MFEGIQRGLGDALKKLRGRGRITEANIREGLQEVRKALLDADVNFNVANDFIERVTEQAGRPGRAAHASTPASRSSRSSTTNWSRLMGPVDHRLPLRQGPADRPHAVRPARSAARRPPPASSP